MATWASLFSGGKDSSLALHLARERGLAVDHLVSVHPPADSFMFHVPATRLAGLAAESIGLPLVEVETPATLEADGHVDASAQGDREIEPLESALDDLAAATDLAGVTAGAVESAFQSDRLRAMCDRLGIDLFAPLWRRDPRDVADELLSSDFEILVVAVAADGLDESWLGRTLDREAFDELARLGESHGVHLLGEGGEYETLVVDGPHMERRIELASEVVWEGDRGHLEIEDAWLG